MMVFKNGMRIELKHETTCEDYTYYFFSFIIMICFHSAIPLYLFYQSTEENFNYIFFLLMFLSYYYYKMSYYSNSTAYIRNKVKLAEVFENIA